MLYQLINHIYHFLLHRPQSSKDPRPLVSKINFKELHQHFLQVQARHREARNKKMIKAATWGGHMSLLTYHPHWPKEAIHVSFRKKGSGVYMDRHGFFPYRGVSLISINIQRGALIRDQLRDTLVEYNH